MKTTCWIRLMPVAGAAGSVEGAFCAHRVVLARINRNNENEVVAFIHSSANVTHERLTSRGPDTLVHKRSRGSIRQLQQKCRLTKPVVFGAMNLARGENQRRARNPEPEIHRSVLRSRISVNSRLWNSG